jgi:hypothetical protein
MKYNNVTIEIEFDYEGSLDEALAKAQAVVEFKIQEVVAKARGEVK